MQAAKLQGKQAAGRRYGLQQFSHTTDHNLMADARCVRQYPIAYPNGAGLGDVSNVKVAKIGANNKSVTLSGLPTGFEVRPHLAPGTCVGNVVVLVKPTVPMIVLPNTLTTTADVATGRGAISFQAVEAR